jgi:hypothetical protein
VDSNVALLYLLACAADLLLVTTQEVLAKRLLTEWEI